MTDPLMIDCAVTGPAVNDAAVIAGQAPDRWGCASIKKGR